jgi:uncharacterized protein YcbK (DUF882 family)
VSKIKIYKKGTGTKISKNFNSLEFDCKCSYPDCQWTKIDMEHIDKLQEKRDEWKKAIKINSAYRCEKYNKDVGGASQSRHIFGDATDIKVARMTPNEVANDCEDIFSGLGKYSSFTHVDSRPSSSGKKYRWDFRKK